MARFVRTATAALAGALVGIALSASAAQFTKNSGGSAGGVSKADFDRLKGEVQAIEGRVAALERMSGHGSGHSGSGSRSGHHTAGDSWTGG